MDVGAALTVTALVALRLAPAALTLPILGGPLAPWSARLALIAMAAFALGLAQPTATAQAAAHLPLVGLAAVAAKELAVGALLALVAAAPLYAADLAGGWIGTAIGPLDARAAGLAGPTRATGLLTSLLAVLVFFAIDGHLIVIRALVGSYDAVPLLAGFERAAAAREVTAAIVGFLAAATALAAPSLVAGGLVEIGLGLAARARGQVAGGASSLRGAAVTAFVAAGLGLLAVAIARDVGAAAHSLDGVLGRVR